MSPMAEPDEALRLHRARVRALPIADLTRDLLKKARGWGIPEATAEELINGALLELVAHGAEKWDHVEDPKAWVFLIRAVEDAWSADKKRRRRRRTDLNTEAVEEAPPDSDPSPAGSALDRDEATRARDLLLERLEGSPLALRVVRLCMEEGEMTPAEIARRTGEPVTRIYEAQRRISQEVEKIVAIVRRRDEREARK